VGIWNLYAKADQELSIQMFGRNAGPYSTFGRDSFSHITRPTRLELTIFPQIFSVVNGYRRTFMAISLIEEGAAFDSSTIAFFQEEPWPHLSAKKMTLDPWRTGPKTSSNASLDYKRQTNSRHLQGCLPARYDFAPRSLNLIYKPSLG